MNTEKRLLSLEELAMQYAKYRDESCLEELKRRDNPNEAKPSDLQMVFDFHKEDVAY